MNVKKATNFIVDPTGKADHEYFNELKNKSKELLNCIEAVPGRRSLLIMMNSGDTYTYTWNSCRHVFNCKYTHHNNIRYGELTKSEAITDIAIDIYNLNEWKLI